jgi:hypothetical protein
MEGMSLSSASRRLAALAGVVVLCTCGTLDRFDVSTSASASIQKATILEELLGAVNFAGFAELDFSKQIANQGVSEDQIDSVKIKSLVIHTPEGSGTTMDFIKSAKFYAEAEGLPRVLVASSAAFTGETSVEMDVDTELELKPYVVAPAMTLSAEVEGKRPPEDTELTADVILTVDATVPGCE